MKKSALFGFAGVLFALAVAVLLRPDKSDGERTAEGAKAAAGGMEKGGGRPAIRPEKRMPVHGGSAGGGENAQAGEEDEDDNRTPAEKTLAERVEKAFDDEDFDALAACADAVRKCDVVEIRQSMVDALGWFGVKSLPELVPFLADSSEDVRDSARSHMVSGLSEIENEAERIGVVESVMKVLDDEDFLDDIAGEFVGIDEKLAVESLVRIVAAGLPQGVAKAKETYELVTGEEWAGEEAARRWIENEYEPPEEP